MIYNSIYTFFIPSLLGTESNYPEFGITLILPTIIKECGGNDFDKMIMKITKYKR